jgi:DmsE family decaheme c-type cytochrome
VLCTPLLYSAPDYAGATTCRTCHPAAWLHFYRNPHFAVTASTAMPKGDAGCESCHGPGAAHVQAKGGAATIKAFSRMTPEQVLDACLTCHRKDWNRSEIRRSSHTQQRVVCTSCHSIHRPGEFRHLLAAPQRDLCYSCHGEVRQQFNLPVKHRVNEGLIRCSDCHNPHGAPAIPSRMGVRPRMVTAFLNETPCIRCHPEYRGPFAFEHAAVRVDGCEVCHAPHGSTNSRLLRRPVVFTLCLECHNGAAPFGRQQDGVRLTSATHDMRSPRFQQCTLCHVRIHGSNADPLFLR